MVGARDCALFMIQMTKLVIRTNSMALLKSKFPTKELCVSSSNRRHLRQYIRRVYQPRFASLSLSTILSQLMPTIASPSPVLHSASTIGSL